MEHNAWVAAVLVGLVVCGSGCGIDADPDLFGPGTEVAGSGGTSGTSGNGGQGGAGAGGMKPAGSGGTGGMMTAGHSGSGGNTAGSGGKGGSSGTGGMPAGSSGMSGTSGIGGMAAGTGGSGGMTAGSSGTGGAMSGTGGMPAGSSGTSGSSGTGGMTAGSSGTAGSGGGAGTGGGPVNNVTFDTLAMGCFKAVIVDDATKQVVSGSGDTDVCPTELASIYVPPGGYTLFVWVRDPTNNLMSFNSAEGFTVVKGRCSLYPIAPTWAQISSDFSTKVYTAISNSAVPPGYLYLKSCPANGDAEYTIHK